MNFEKEIVQGPQKQCSQAKNKNLEITKKKQNKQDQISDATYISDVVFDIVVFDKN